MSKKRSTTALISDLKRKTRRNYSSEEKIKIYGRSRQIDLSTFPVRNALELVLWI